MNVLVTGGLGVNGVWVVRELFDLGHKPVIYDNRKDVSLIPDLAEQLTIVDGDLLDLANLIRTIKEHKIEVVVHMGAVMPFQAQANPVMGLQVNALGTVNALEAARTIGVRRVVFTSSKAVYAPFTGDHGFPTYKLVGEDYPKYPDRGIVVYGAAKVASELMGFSYAQDYGLEFIALGFATIYGVGKKARHGPIAIHSEMIENAMLGKPTVIAHGGDEKDDMIYVKDVAHAIVAACSVSSLKSKALNVGSGCGYTLGDLARAVRSVLPGAQFQIGGGLDYMGMGHNYCIMDIARAKEELDFSPRFTLEDGVRDYVETVRRLGLLA